MSSIGGFTRLAFFARHSGHSHSFRRVFSYPLPFDPVLCNEGFSGLCDRLFDSFPPFLTVALLPALASSGRSGCASRFDSSDDESPLPSVAAVWLEYPESLNSSRNCFPLDASGFDRLAAMLAVQAVCRVSGSVICASSLNSSQKAARVGGGLLDILSLDQGQPDPISNGQASWSNCDAGLMAER